MRGRFLLAGVTAAGVVVLAAPASQAASSTPLDCSGVVAAPGGYRLIDDTTCNLDWGTSHESLDLDHHTFSGVITTPNGYDLTIKNGTLNLTAAYFGNAVTLSRVTVRSAPDAVPDFLIEAGSNFVAENSRFVDVSSAVALDFYFGNVGRVVNSEFAGNQIAISVQESNDVRLESDRFVRNLTGVSLFDENDEAVRHTVIRKDHFVGNSAAGLTVQGYVGESVPGNAPLVGTTVENNTFEGNGGPGVAVELSCYSFEVCAPQMTFAHNALTRNGFGGDAVLARSGMYARGTTLDDGSPYPSILGAINVASNRADRNSDLGLDVPGVMDGGGNRAHGNGNPLQCVGVTCLPGGDGPHSASVSPSASPVSPSGSADPVAAIPVPPRHH